MFRRFIIYFFSLLTFNANGQYKLINVDCDYDTIIEPSCFLIGINFEIDPFKCDPNVGVVTFDQKFKQLLDVAQVSQIDSKNIYQVFHNNSDEYRFHVTSNDKNQLHTFLKECVFYRIFSDGQLMSGYNENSSDILKRYYSELTSKAIDEGLKIGKTLTGKNDFEITYINEKSNLQNNDLISIYEGNYYYSTKLKFETQLNLTLKH